MGRTRKKPMIIGSEVPRASTIRKADVFPANNKWDMLEKKKADNPKPLMTRPVVDARCEIVMSNYSSEKRNSRRRTA
jgi:hypothetical protein